MPARAPSWAPPLLAAQFLTRLPVPALARLTPEQAGNGLARSMAWLPPVGTLVGLFTAGVYFGAATLWPAPIAALLALAAEALLTGAFHEDAVADFCDAFGGTAQGDEARRIMRDSRIGSYGALGLGLCVALRWAAIFALAPELALAAIVGAATAGRLAAVALATLLAPAGDGVGMAVRAGRVPPTRCFLALLLSGPGLIGLALLQPAVLAAATLAAVALMLWLRAFLLQRIGGTTGDCLGFAAYGVQLLVLLAATAR